ncbi:hypothetical protein ScPMuIL_011331 [Solemya velum]
MECVGLLVIVLLVIIEVENGFAKLRKRDFQVEAQGHGANMCEVLEKQGTGEQFYPDCIRHNRVKRVCDSKTFIRYQCCSGYKKVEGKSGCPGLKPLKNLVESLKDLGLTEFLRLLKNTDLEDNLAYQGAFTIFAPVNEAFSNLSYTDRQRLYPWTYNAPSIMHYHVVSGRQNYTDFRRHKEVPTLYYGEKKIRINKYSFGVGAVNCARITLPNQLATNGIIHVIDKVLKPLDYIGSIADVILKNTMYSTFATVLYRAEMVEFLRDNKHYTVFAPSNSAFERLSESLRRKVLRDKATAQAVVKYHIIKGVYCEDAVIISCGLTTLEGDRLTFRCRQDGSYVDDAKVIQGDITAKNGVVHGISKVILPDSVKDMLQLSRDLSLNTFVELTHKTGMEDELETRPDFTLFAPSDAAFAALPPVYFALLQSQPSAMERLIRYHTINGKIKMNDMVGEQSFQSGLDSRLKVNVFRNGITLDDAQFLQSDKECNNGIVHIINKVLIPPEQRLKELIAADADISTFKAAIDTARLSNSLTENGQFTVLAPTNHAFRVMRSSELDKYLNNPPVLRKLIERHISNKTVISCGITPESIYTINSKQSEPIELYRNGRGTIWVNNYAKVLSADKIALNGVLMKIDRILACETCKNP